MAIVNIATLSDLFAACPVKIIDTYGYLGVVGGTVNLLDLVVAIGPSGYVDNGDGTYTLTPGNGLGAIVIGGSVLSTITDNADGTYTHNDGSGNLSTIDTTQAPASVLTDNADGTYTHQDGKGNVQVIDTNNDPSILTDNNNGTYTHDDGLGTTTLINVNQNIVVVTDNADGTYTIDDGQGNTTVINTVTAHTPSSVVDNADGTYTHNDGDGNAVVIDTVTANTTSSVVNNADGTYTHNDGDGNAVLIDTVTANTTSSMANNADGTYTHNDGDGNNVVINVCSSLQYCLVSDISDVSAFAPSTDQALMWDGTIWYPTTVSAPVVSFTPGSPGNWPGAPSTVQNGLDTIAGRQKFVINTPSSPPFVALADNGSKTLVDLTNRDLTASTDGIIARIDSTGVRHFHDRRVGAILRGPKITCPFGVLAPATIDTITSSQNFGAAVGASQTVTVPGCYLIDIVYADAATNDLATVNDGFIHVSIKVNGVSTSVHRLQMEEGNGGSNTQLGHGSLVRDLSAGDIVTVDFLNFATATDREIDIRELTITRVTSSLGS